MPFFCALNPATAGGSLPIADYVALAGRHGYRWIELDSSKMVALAAMGASAAGDLLTSSNVRIASFFLPVDWRGNEQVFERDILRLSEVLDGATALRVSRSCTWLPPNFATPPSETRRLVARRFRRIAAMLQDHGLRFGLEFIGPAHLREAPGHTFIFRMEDMVAFAEEIGPNVGVLVDALHWHCLGGMVEALASIPPERLVYAHIDDAPNRPRHLLRDDERLLPGDGSIDLCGFLSGLSAAGYDGPVGIEIDGSALRHLTDDDAAAAARRAFENVLAAYLARPPALRRG
jgi:sugar phosphate isomerase/epimerase